MGRHKLGTAGIGPSIAVAWLLCVCAIEAAAEEAGWNACPLTSPPRFLVRFDGTKAAADFVVQELTKPGDFGTVEVELRDLADTLIASQRPADAATTTPDGLKAFHFACDLPAPGVYRVNVNWRRRTEYTIRLVGYDFHTDKVCVEGVEFPCQAWDTVYFMVKAGARSVALNGSSWHGTGAEIAVIDDSGKQRGLVRIEKKGEKWSFRESISPPAQDLVWSLRIRGSACGRLGIPGAVSPNAAFLKELSETVLPAKAPTVAQGLQRVKFIDIGDASDAPFVVTAGPRRIERFTSVRQVNAEALPQPHARFGFSELKIPVAPDLDQLLRLRVIATEASGAHGAGGVAFSVLVNGARVRVGRGLAGEWSVVEARVGKELVGDRREATLRLIAGGGVFLDWIDVLAAPHVPEVFTPISAEQPPPCEPGKFVRIAPGGCYLVLDGKPWYPVGGGGTLGDPPGLRCDLGGKPEPTYTADDWKIFVQEWCHRANCFKKGTGNYHFSMLMPGEERLRPGCARTVKLLSDWRTYFQACRRCGLRTIMALTSSGCIPADVAMKRENVEDVKAWIRFVVPQFKDEPAIASWAICNEPNWLRDVTNEQLLAWHEEMAKLVKELDPNHLVGADMMESPHPLTGRIVAQAPSLDWVSDHPYCDLESMVARVKYIQCGKPALIDECWQKDAEEFKDFMMHALFAGVAGFHCWMGFPYTDEHWARMTAFLKLVRRLDMDAFAPAADVAIEIPMDVWCAKEARGRTGDVLSLYPNAKMLFDAGVPFDLIADRGKEGQRYQLVVGPTEPKLDEARIAPFRLVRSETAVRFLAGAKRTHYLVWLKAEQGAAVALRAMPPRQYTTEWIDVATGETIESKTVPLSGVAELAAPRGGELVLCVRPAP